MTAHPPLIASSPPPADDPLVPPAWRPLVWWAPLRADPVRRVAGAGYARLSLGPGQRIAAQSGQVLAFQAPGFTWLAPLGPLLRADD